MKRSTSLVGGPQTVLDGMSTEARNRAAIELERRVSAHLSSRASQRLTALLAVDAMLVVAGLTEFETDLVIQHPQAAARIRVIVDAAISNLATRVRWS